MKLSIPSIVTIACLMAFNSFADATVAYKAGEDLATDKIAIVHDDSGKISSLAMNPASGETLTLTGDTLSFAANAVVSPGGQTVETPGMAIVSNSFTAAGSLKFSGITNVTWVSSNGKGMLSKSFETVFSDMSIDDIIPVSSVGYNHFALGEAPVPFFIERGEDDGEKWMKFELHSYSSNLIRGLYIALKQNGENVEGRVLAARHTANLSSYGKVAMFTSKSGAGGWGYSSASGYTDYRINAPDTDQTGFNITTLTIGPRSGSKSKLTFVVSDDMMLPAISGGGVEVTFDAVVSKSSISENMVWSTSHRGLKKSDFEVLFESVSIDDITPVAATGVSYFANGDQPEVFNIVRGEDDGVKWMKFELQAKDTDEKKVRCLYLSLIQNGNNVEGKILGARYNPNSNAELLKKYGQALFTSTSGDTGFESAAPDGYINYNNIYAADTTGGGFGVSSLTVAPRSLIVKAKGENTMIDSAFLIRGFAAGDARSLVYDVAAKYALPSVIECCGNATLNISVSGGSYNDGACKDREIIMREGTTLAAPNEYPFYHSSGSVVLDGAILTQGVDKRAYFNYLTLMNGATVEADMFNAGFSADHPAWTVSGTGRSTYSGNLQLYGKNNAANDLTVDVGETAEGTDFLLKGDVYVNQDSRYVRSGIIKRGTGTMEIDGTLYTTNRATYVCEGTILLSKSGATMEDTMLELQGGTFACKAGTVNTAKVLTVNNADSTLSLASGASLVLEGLTIADGLTFNITFADGACGVKILSALDSATLSRIRLNGRRVTQNDAGFLSPVGLVVSLR